MIYELVGTTWSILLRLALLRNVARSPVPSWAPPDGAVQVPLLLLRSDSDRRRPDADWRSLDAPPEKQPDAAAPVRQKTNAIADSTPRSIILCKPQLVQKLPKETYYVHRLTSICATKSRMLS